MNEFLFFLPGNIIILERIFLFAEISHKMTTLRVGRCHDVEEEGFDVKVQRFVVQEKFGQQAQTLAILLVTFSANFEHRNLKTSKLRF